MAPPNSSIKMRDMRLNGFGNPCGSYCSRCRSCDCVVSSAVSGEMRRSRSGNWRERETSKTAPLAVKRADFCPRTFTVILRGLMAFRVTDLQKSRVGWRSEGFLTSHHMIIWISFLDNCITSTRKASKRQVRVHLFTR